VRPTHASLAAANSLGKMKELGLHTWETTHSFLYALKESATKPSGNFLLERSVYQQREIRDNKKY
jgi:hypothetical protein